MLNTFRRASLRFRDTLRYSPMNIESVALLRAVKGRLIGGARGRAELLKAYRLTERPALLEALGQELRPFLEGRPSDPRAELQDSGGHYASMLARPALDRTIVLKAPGEGG